MSRNTMLACVHIARKDLGLDETTYREVISRISGGRCESAGDLTERELELTIASFKARGWQPKPAGANPRSASRRVSRKEKGKRSESPHVRKVWALWGDMCRDGLVREPTRGALRAFVQRMTKVSDPEWLTPAQANVVIEGLKAWAARARAEAGAP